MSVHHTKCVVLWGQSNAQGQSLVKGGLTDQTQYDELSTVKCSYMLQCNSDSQAGACATEYGPFNLIGNPQGTHNQTEFGPELAIGRNIPNIISHNTDPTMIIKVTTGSTGFGSIANQLIGSWSPEATSGEMMYARMISFVSFIMDNYVGAGNWEVAAMLGMIGEFDAVSSPASLDFAARMQSFINAVRGNSGWANSYAVNAICPHADRAGIYDGNVRTGHVTAAAALANCVTYNWDAEDTQVDDVHGTEDAIIAVGAGMAALADAAVGACV